MKNKNVLYIFFASLFLLPIAVNAKFSFPIPIPNPDKGNTYTTPAVTVDLNNKIVTITNGLNEAELDFSGSTDIQAIRIERDSDYYFAILRFKDDTVRLFLYDKNGVKIDGEKVMSAADAKDFSILRTLAKVVNDDKRIEVCGIKLNESAQPTKHICKLYRVHPTKDDPIALKSETKTDIKYPDLSGLSDQDAGMALFNYHRLAAGVLPVERYSDTDEACSLHAKYMATNDMLEHSEDPALPGYTAEGEAAGNSSNVARNTKNGMVTALNMWLDGTYHRFPMLDGSLYGTGFGIAGPSNSHYYYSALDITTKYYSYALSGRETNVTYFDPMSLQTVISPGVNQTNVETTMSQSEWPDPLDKFNGSYPAGYAITATPGRTYIEDLYLQLYNAQGDKVFTYWQPPGDATDPNSLYQGSNYSLIPASPLANKTKYTVKMTGKVDGVAYTKEWQFTTK
ncbi:MAG: CAP domain-containing protein [Patescibacteria group bacterium]|jgi:hypothetical protein